MQENLYSIKEENYFSLVRQDIVKLIPEGTKRVLDVGCADGATGEEIKRRFSAEVIGVELYEDAADIAKKRLDQVFCSDVETFRPSFDTGYFDCIIFADVLEHTKNPWMVLARYMEYLSPEGCVVASIPNIRYIVPVLKILFNRFEYEPSGVLDQTHLRFFTYHTIKKLFSICGLKIVRHETNRNRGWKMNLLTYLSFGLLKDFSVFQHLVVAKKVQ